MSRLLGDCLYLWAAVKQAEIEKRRREFEELHKKKVVQRPRKPKKLKEGEEKVVKKRQRKTSNVGAPIVTDKDVRLFCHSKLF